MTYIGAETIISPLGNDAAENFQALAGNRSGIALITGAGFNNLSVHLSKISDKNLSFETLIARTLRDLTGHVDPSVISSEKTILIVSSTKGALDSNIKDQFGGTMNFLKREFNLFHEPLVISNACISGVLAINAGHNLIKAGVYDHAMVVGCDVISDFVVFGFQSLFAMSEQPCRPFSEERDGITMGEGGGAVLISKYREVFAQPAMELLGGTSANDANHISGPSRTGEGLYRSVSKTMKINGLDVEDLDFISAHGTATVYNDEMESIAFDRLGMNNIPVNSFKGYFGHTLGAAGVIETAASMQMMRNNLLVKSLGYTRPGTSKSLNIIEENSVRNLNTILKTASGFGGGNASLAIRKI